MSAAQSLASERILEYGNGAPLPERRTLCAGPVTVEFENGDLRYIRCGGIEIVRRIYVAVRDRNWDTIAPVLSNLELKDGGDSFEVTFGVEHRQADVHFTWRGAITGDTSGKITYSMDGKAVSTFLKNRIGICLLHPDSAAGAPATVGHMDGSVERKAFPDLISPHQPFFDIASISHEATPGLVVKVAFEGETFEMEDQRNWTDGSFKTYSTPLREKFPVEIRAGAPIRHAVTLTVERAAQPRARHAISGPVVIEAEGRRYPLPEIGLAVASDGRALSASETHLLKALGLSHLRAEVDLTRPGWQEPLLSAHAQAAALDVSLQLGLIVNDGAERQLGDLARYFHLRPALLPEWRLFFIFHAGEKATSARWVELARAALAKYAQASRFGGGTRNYFTELNRNRPETPPPWVTWSINPQVHAFDNSSMVETLATQAACIRSARAFLPGSKLAIGPITLRPRFNPNATSPQTDSARPGLPPQADPRQMSLFCAGWTLGSIKHMAQAGADNLTYFETVGPLGVVKSATGSPGPAKFQSVPGGGFPVYHLLEDISDFRGGQVVGSMSSRPLEVESIVLEKDGKKRTTIANFTQVEQQVKLQGAGLANMHVKILSAANAGEAARAPEAYHRAAAGMPLVNKGGSATFSLPPFAIARID